MNLKLVRFKGFDNGQYIALADENGELLPCQTSCTLETRIQKPVRLVVEFLILPERDGDKIQIALDEWGTKAPRVN